MTYRTIIFDFDGTIADTLEEGRTIFNAIAADNGIRTITKDEVESLRGYSINDFIKQMDIPATKVPVFLAKGTMMMRRSIAGLPLIAGMDEVLHRLRPQVDRFGILTSNAVENVEVFLSSHGIRGLFDFIWSTSKLTGKARYLNAARKQFGLKAEEILYVGDELRDLKAAHKAGVGSAGVCWGFNSHTALSAENPDHLFESPSELLSLARH